MSRPKLSIQDLSKVFANGKQTREVLSSIAMHVNHGEFVSVLGPSGCGKSTLLNIIAGLEKETSGIIIIDGNKEQKRLGKSGYMLQKPLLLPWKTVEENVMLGLSIRHLGEKTAKQQTNSLLKKFGLDTWAKEYPATLSGGMAQRVSLLRTILFNNDFWLFDEPFGSLDALTRLSMQMWLLDVWKTYKTSVLFVTHDIREAIFLSDRIYVLSNQPTKILYETSVRLPRPRKREFLAKIDALELEQKLENLLLKEQYL